MWLGLITAILTILKCIVKFKATSFWLPRIISELVCSSLNEFVRKRKIFSWSFTFIQLRFLQNALEHLSSLELAQKGSWRGLSEDWSPIIHVSWLYGFVSTSELRLTSKYSGQLRKTYANYMKFSSELLPRTVGTYTPAWGFLNGSKQ